MTEIDEPEGMELAAAVAEALGWHKHEYRGAYRGGYSAWFWANSDDVDQMEVAYYRPHRNIAQAWELLDGFVYSIDNHEWREDQDDDPVGCCLKRGGWAEVASGHTASVAICRAFLKAKAAQ